MCVRETERESWWYFVTLCFHLLESSKNFQTVSPIDKRMCFHIGGSEQSDLFKNNAVSGQTTTGLKFSKQMTNDIFPELFSTFCTVDKKIHNEHEKIAILTQAFCGFRSFCKQKPELQRRIPTEYQLIHHNKLKQAFV